jgi:hypothetical protein
MVEMRISAKRDANPRTKERCMLVVRIAWSVGSEITKRNSGDRGM